MSAEPNDPVATGGQMIATFIRLHGNGGSVEENVVDIIADVLRWYATIPENDESLSLDAIVERALGHAEYELEHAP